MLWMVHFQFGFLGKYSDKTLLADIIGPLDDISDEVSQLNHTPYAPQAISTTAPEPSLPTPEVIGEIPGPLPMTGLEKVCIVHSYVFISQDNYGFLDIPLQQTKAV